MNPVYVYGVIRSGHSLNGIRAGGHPVEAIEFHNLAAVVSDVPGTDLEARDLNLADETWLETWASRHVDVISAVFASTDVLPLKFATLCSDRSRVRDLVRTRFDELQANLERISGAEEYVVSAWTSRSWVMGDNGSLTPGRVYLMERRLEARHRGRTHTLDAIDASARQLRQLAREYRALAPDVEQAVRDARVVYKEAFLVDRRRRVGFLATAGRCRELLETAACSLAWSGPWPPFNFAQPEGGKR